VILDSHKQDFVLLLLYAHRHRSILGAAGHIILTPANQLMEKCSEPQEQSCLLRWTEKIASLCFGPSGDQTPYLLIRSQTLIDCATGPGSQAGSSTFRVHGGHTFVSRLLLSCIDCIGCLSSWCQLYASQVYPTTHTLLP
jgi:hypothetical protein